MQDQAQIVVTGSRHTGWPFEFLLEPLLIVSVLILVAAIFIPAIRRRLALTPFSSFLLLVGVICFGLQKATYYDVIPELTNWQLDAGIDLSAAPLIFAAAVLVFVAAQLKLIILPSESAAEPARDLGGDVPMRTSLRRFPLSFAAAREYMQRRRAFVRDPNAIADAVSHDPSFNPLGYKVREIALAGLPAAALGGFVWVVAKIYGHESEPSEDALLAEAASFVGDIVKPYLLPIGLLVTGTIAAWAIVGIRSSRTRLARQLYLTVDGTRSLIPETVTVFVFGIVSGLISLYEHGVFESISLDGDGDAVHFLNGLGLGEWPGKYFSTLGEHGVVTLLVVIVWLPALYLAAIRLFVIPASVARILGPEAAGSVGFAVLRHTLFFVGLPILVAAALSGILMWASSY